MRLGEINEVLKGHDEILFAYLYGSFAKGEQKKGSDVDIAVFLKKGFKKGHFYEVELALEIEKKTKLKNVEVVVLNNKGIRFLNQVLRYGKLIFSINDKERINFETSITKKYIDLKPFYREYDEMRAKRLLA